MPTTDNRGYNLIPESGDFAANANTFINQVDKERYVKRKGVDQSSTSDSLVDVSDLEFPIAANEQWQFDFQLAVGCDNTGGFKVALSVPAGSDFIATSIGIGGSAGSGGRDRLTVSDSPSAVAYNTFSAAVGDVRVVGSIANGATAGVVKVRFQVVTSGQTGTVYAGSTLVANRI